MSSRLSLVPLILLMLLLSAACGPDRGAYIDANKAIIDELPLFPGAVEIARESISYTFEDGGLFDAAEGYGTRVTYRVPSGTTEDDVWEFYSSVTTATRWSTHVEEIPVVGGGREPNWHLSRCRDESHIAINLANVEHTFDLGGTFDLGIDHSYAEPGYRTAC